VRQSRAPLMVWLVPIGLLATAVTVAVLALALR
jgi:hypothetical protein